MIKNTIWMKLEKHTNKYTKCATCLYTTDVVVNIQIELTVYVHAHDFIIIYYYTRIKYNLYAFKWAYLFFIHIDIS